MTASRRPQFLIAEFARHCRLPVSTLRYYDRLGLLPGLGSCFHRTFR